MHEFAVNGRPPEVLPRLDDISFVDLDKAQVRNVGGPKPISSYDYKL